MGRGLLGTYGQEIIKTPNIDRLAKEGIRFNNVYGCMYCAPARASLLTGMHDCHKQVFNITKGGLYKQLDINLTLDEIKSKIEATALPAKRDEVFLAQVAKKAGYVTAQFGKLEWGFSTTPERLSRHGWDYHFGYYDHVRCHGFYPPFLFENGKKIEIPGNTHIDCAKTSEPETDKNYNTRWDMKGKKVYSENIIMDKLLSFVDDQSHQNTQNPFFIFFPTQLPHGPVMIPEVHADFKNNEALSEIEKEYASMVKMLDTDVGRIWDKLEELDILDNTIIIFTADNGHEIYYSKEGRCVKGNRTLAGESYDNIHSKFYSELAGDVFDGNDGMAGLKRSNWEGGVRVPLFWYWKDKIAKGAVSNKMVSNYDLLNTIAEIVGVDQLADKDGKSYSPLLFGQQCVSRDYTIYASIMGPALVTNDGWKLRYYLKKDVFQLYYLPDDYREEKDLSAVNQAKLETLKNILFKECDNDWKNGYGPQVKAYK